MYEHPAQLIFPSLDSQGCLSVLSVAKRITMKTSKFLTSVCWWCCFSLTSQGLQFAQVFLGNQDAEGFLNFFYCLFFLTQSAHMPMIDALMMAYTVEMISIEKVVASVKRFSTFSASKELPFDLEDAMVFWINKV